MTGILTFYGKDTDPKPLYTSLEVVGVEAMPGEEASVTLARFRAYPGTKAYTQAEMLNLDFVPIGTGTEGTNQGNTINDFANSATTYGTWRLRNINDTSFFNPRVILNSDGSYSLADDSGYTAPSGKAVCYQLDYNIAGFGITSLSGRVFWRPLFIQKFEYETARPDYERLQVARVDHNTIIR